MLQWCYQHRPLFLCRKLRYVCIKMEHVEKALKALQNGWESEERKWLVSLRSPLDIWQENPTFLACEIVLYVWAFLTLRHGECELLCMEG